MWIPVAQGCVHDRTQGAVTTRKDRLTGWMPTDGARMMQR
jgi:hypothetical protein